MVISTKSSSQASGHRERRKARPGQRFFAWLLIGLLTLLWLAAPMANQAQAQGATLSFSPLAGEYFVGSTFETSLVLNTAGRAINAIDITVRFPADKLQVVNLSRSFIEVWIAQPSFFNAEGAITLVGGLPNPGLTTNSGIVTTVTFRVKAGGAAKLTYESSSKVLANDGGGTNILTNRREAQYSLKLPAPEGPQVTSPTHPDPNTWYSSAQIGLQWSRGEGVTGFSYTFDTLAQTVPDETPDTDQTFTTLTAKEDGVWYFHIRSLTDIWGGTTHFPVRVDTKPPAKFTPEITPKIIPVNQRGVLTFKTTDASSGVDYYEVKVLSLNDVEQDATIFTEESSPYLLPTLKTGKYQAVVRAYDRAGNYYDGTVEFTVAGAFLAMLATNPWVTLLLSLLLLGVIIVSVLISHRLTRRREQLSNFNAAEAIQGQNPGQGPAA